jgi:hypothetical protein
MTYTQTPLATLRSKTGSLLQKLYSEFGLVKTELDALAAVDAAGLKIAKGALTAGNANDFAFAWQNPEASKIIVTRVLINITTAGGTGSSVLDVGVVENATSTADNLIDGLDLNATGIFDNITDKGDNGKSRQVVDEKGGTNDYITGKILVQDAAALAGKYYILYTVI